MNNLTVSKANKALVAPPLPGVATMFPRAPALPDGNIVVPHNMHSTLIMRHLGFDVPNPVLLYYDFCGGKPYAVQRATVKLLTEHARAYVLNAMGTGKTKTVLWAWDALRKEGLAKKLLVVAPLSTLHFVWAREVFQTLPHCKVQVLHGSRQDRLNMLALDADVYIINHDGVKVIESELQARADIDALCLDELAVYRNNSERSKRMRKFAKRFNTVWGLTGGPMPTEPTDVWGQCMIITPNTVPSFRNRCRDLLMTRQSTYVWVPKPDAVDRAFGMMQPSVRYSLDDVTELPPLIERMEDVALSAEQEQTYKRVATALSAMVQNKQITAVNAGVAMGKLLQIAGGWVYTQNPEFVRLDASPRIVALADFIESASNKVLVAVPYRHMIEGISKIFSMPSINIDHCVVHGETTHREKIFHDFQTTARYKVMLAHPGCVHHGLTLTAADTTIWYLPVTSLEVYDQFNARFRRIGQAHKQQLIHLQATPIEKKVYRMLRAHQRLQDKFLQLVEDASGEAP